MAKKNYESKIANKTRNFVQVQHKEATSSENSSTVTEVAEIHTPVTETVNIEGIAAPPLSNNHKVSESGGIIRRPGRKKELEGEYHVFAARIRQDLFDYAQQISGKNKQYQSVNAYINELIWNDMNK